MKMKFKINKKERTLDVDKSMPILWMLRDVANLKGTRFGCGKGLCGACTVHLDGVAIRSCITPSEAANGKGITTIEGLSDNGDHPLQKSWIKHNVPQCGYCQPGQIMNAASLLNQNKKPNDTQIDEGMAGNICRCGTYTRVREAIKDAAKG
ncbi:MAG: (2Fe-2S)-binding protein [Pseudobacteriovorax sp.]|nr:(2Fe-2S)-binding protein [Pseudobacteriovorax sp.]